MIDCGILFYSKVLFLRKKKHYAAFSLKICQAAYSSVPYGWLVLLSILKKMSFLIFRILTMTLTASVGSPLWF